MIILKGAGEIKTWQFPNITNCPVPKCPKQFENRTEAIIHYKKKHIMNYQYCDICKGPVPTHNCKKFSDHLKKDHGLGVDKDTNKVLHDLHKYLTAQNSCNFQFDTFLE